MPAIYYIGVPGFEPGRNLLIPNQALYQTELHAASFLGGSSTTGLPALLVHFRSLPSGGLPSGGVQNLNWTMH